jgi:hypothetical protein
LLPIIVLFASHGVPTLPAQDSIILDVVVYLAVLEHAVSTSSSRPGLPVVIEKRVARYGCAPFCADTTFFERVISDDEIETLKNRNLIIAACRQPDRTIGCSAAAGHTFVRLGVPYRTPSDLRVQAGDGDMVAILRRDGDPVSVHVGVNVLIFEPCVPEQAPCDYPNIDLYTYFLQAVGESYRVVARMHTGGA